MPLFSILYFIFILSNFGFPGTFNFVGELLILVGGFAYTNVMIFVATFGMILSLIYSLFTYNRLFFGSLQITFVRYFCDCTRLEFLFLFLLSFLVLFFGFCPQYFFEFIQLMFSNQLIFLSYIFFIKTNV